MVKNHIILWDFHPTRTFRSVNLKWKAHLKQIHLYFSVPGCSLKNIDYQFQLRFFLMKNLFWIKWMMILNIYLYYYIMDTKGKALMNSKHLYDRQEFNNELVMLLLWLRTMSFFQIYISKRNNNLKKK